MIFYHHHFVCNNMSLSNKIYKFGTAICAAAILSACSCGNKVPEGEMTATATPENAETKELASFIDRVYFAFNKNTLSAEAAQVIDEQIKFLGNGNVVIEGHCDERGTREYNLALGERRANAVKKYMESHGVDRNRLSIVSYGKERPQVDGHNEDAWAKNRVAITVKDQSSTDGGAQAGN